MTPNLLVLKVFLLLVINILLYLILIKVRKNYLDIFQAPEADYYKFLHYFYSNNIYTTILNAIAYISLAFLVFFMFRFNRLNLNYNIFDIQSTNDNAAIYSIQLILMLIFFLLYRLVLQELFFRALLRLHIYNRNYF